jgi:hypothetical protein
MNRKNNSRAWINNYDYVSYDPAVRILILFAVGLVAVYRAYTGSAKTANTRTVSLFHANVKRANGNAVTGSDPIIGDYMTVTPDGKPVQRIRVSATGTDAGWYGTAWVAELISEPAKPAEPAEPAKPAKKKRAKPVNAEPVNAEPVNAEPVNAEPGNPST